MNSRVHGGSHHAEQVAHDAQTGDEHASQALTGHLHAQRSVMQRTKLRAKIQHNKAQAAFFKNKRFAAANHRPASAGAQKMLRQLGQRPRPGQSAKARGKDGAARDPREDERRKQQQNHKHDDRHEQGHEQHAREHEHEHDRHEGQDQGQRQGQGQNPGRGQGQQQDPAQRERQQQERRERASKFAIKAGNASARRALPAPPAALQSIAAQHGGTRDLPDVLANAYTKAVVDLTSKMELGPLLAPLLVLGMASPMVLKRRPARLHAHLNGALANRAQSASGADPAGKSAAVAGVLGHSVDMTLARQRFSIEYSDDEQSLAMVKQRLLDATRTAPTGTPKHDADASRNSQQIRVTPSTPGAGT
ncbi:helicase [Paraburkholderia solisilvae]|uniref:Uncharacterized protein n=1 Tax=Paraburkholderia solisilvae TaxID=624376 RepID=A0A6J5ETC8_9BURK|nr:helicase [Paraburkholderia solisilvae]CAB3769453.1 hypothetical protein LMG29739_05552 [Paraburkholderia solisilvae]